MSGLGGLELDNLQRVQIGINSSVENPPPYTVLEVGVYKNDKIDTYPKVEIEVDSNRKIVAEFGDAPTDVLWDEVVVLLNGKFIDFSLSGRTLIAQPSISDGTHTVSVIYGFDDTKRVMAYTEFSVYSGYDDGLAADVVLLNESVDVTVSSVTGEAIDCTVIAAFYKEGNIVMLESIENTVPGVLPFGACEYNFTRIPPDYDEVKLFFWDRINTLKPIMEVKRYESNS